MGSIKDLRLAAALWPLVDDALTTMTTRGRGHPALASERSPLRVSIIDLKRDMVTAVTEAAHIVGLLTPDDVGSVTEACLADMLTRIDDEMRRRCATPSDVPSWRLSTTLVDVLDPVLARLDYLLGEAGAPSSCPRCGQPVTAMGDDLRCPVCGTVGLPRYVTCREAATVFGITERAVRLRVRRHGLVGLAGEYPPRYRLDDLTVLCRRSRPRQAWHGTRSPIPTNAKDIWP